MLTEWYPDHCVFTRAALARMFKEPIEISNSKEIIWKHIDIMDYHFIHNHVQETFQMAGRRMYLPEYIFPIKRCFLEGVEMRCPNNPKMYLSNHYPDYNYSNLDVPDKICKNNRWITRKNLKVE